MPRKKVTRVELGNLLKRRKRTFEQFLAEFAITTYDQLARTCDSLGVDTPAHESFDAVVKKPVTNPLEGVAVFDVEPTPFVEEPAQVVSRKRRRKEVESD